MKAMNEYMTAPLEIEPDVEFWNLYNAWVRSVGMCASGHRTKWPDYYVAGGICQICAGKSTTTVIEYEIPF